MELNVYGSVDDAMGSYMYDAIDDTMDGVDQNCDLIDGSSCDIETTDIGSAVGDAVVTGDTTGLSNDALGSCAFSTDIDQAGDAHFLWTPPADGCYIIDTDNAGTILDSRLMVHTSCDLTIGSKNLGQLPMHSARIRTPLGLLRLKTIQLRKNIRRNAKVIILKSVQATWLVQQHIRIEHIMFPRSSWRF